MFPSENCAVSSICGPFHGQNQNSRKYHGQRSNLVNMLAALQNLNVQLKIDHIEILSIEKDNLKFLS